jgi:hypothetical protein
MMDDDDDDDDDEYIAIGGISGRETEVLGDKLLK